MPNPAHRHGARGRHLSSRTRITEVILHLLARAPAGTLEQQLSHALAQVTGAYSLTILTPDAMYAVRDPSGFRPLSLGRLADSWVVASETCALDLIEAKFERE